MQNNLLTQAQMKRTISIALEKNDYEAVLTYARQSRKALSVLIRLAYDKGTLIGQRAIIAIGFVAALFVKTNYEFLRETIRKLLWSLSDESGGIGWSAPEILGEIVSADPTRFADIVPLIAEVYSVEERVFRPGVLYALKKIAEIQPDLVCPFRSIIIDGLSDHDPMARIYALELIMVLHASLTVQDLKDITRHINMLVEDRTEAWIYKNAGFNGVEVRELALQVQEVIKNTIASV